MSSVEELTLKLIDGTITDSELEELEQIVSTSTHAYAIHLSLLEQEAILRGAQRPVDLAEPTLDHIRGMLEQRIEEGVLRQIRREGRVPVASDEPIDPIHRVEGEWRWLGGRPFWNVVAATVILAVIVTVLKVQGVTKIEADPQEAFLFGQWNLTPGMTTAYRLFVRDARVALPVNGACISLGLLSADGILLWEEESTTDAAGMAIVKPHIAADLPEGEYTLRARASSDRGESELFRTVTVHRSFRLLITTDKPVYQPGQTIHIRAVGLAAAGLVPIEGREITLEVHDSKGNKVFKKLLKASAFGIASADFVLADQVHLGTYTVAAVVGHTRTERTIDLERYVLPKFRIDVDTDRSFYAPGERVQATLSARYLFGKPIVDGEITVRALEFAAGFDLFHEIEGRTNGEGVYAFEIPLKRSFAGIDFKKGDAHVGVDVSVTDGAGQTETRRIDLSVTMRPIRIDVIPEAGVLKRNVENRLYIVTSSPDGQPAQTTIDLSIGHGKQRSIAGITTSKLGIASVAVMPEEFAAGGARGSKEGARDGGDDPNSIVIRPYEAFLPVEIHARDAGGASIEVLREVPLDEFSDSFLLHTDKTVYEAGETVWISLVSARGWSDVFVDVIHDGRTLLAKRTEVRNWQGAVEFDLPLDLCGTLEINAYRVERDGEIVGDRRLIQVNRPDGMTITAVLDRETYRPGAEAAVDFTVTDERRQPVQAALGLSCVDEAVFALTAMRPGFERLYFTLQEELLEPRYEIHASLPLGAHRSAIKDQSGDREADAALTEATEVLFSAAAGGEGVERAASESYDERHEVVKNRKGEFFDRFGNFMAYVPAGLFFALVLPLIVYALCRLVVRRSSAGVTGRDSQVFRSEVWTLTSSWGASLVVLPLFVLLQVRGRHGWGTLLASVGIFLLIVAAVTLLVVRIKRVRRLRASFAAPLFRKLLLVLPVAFPIALLSQIFLIMPGRGGLARSADTAGVVVLLVWIAAVTVAGALGASARVVVERTTVLGWLGVFFGRTLIAATPIVLVVVLGLLRITMVGGYEDENMILDASYMEAEIEAPLGDRGGPAEGKEPAGGLDGAPTARVRRDFPETLYWQPELITDDAGRGRVTIPLADSITTWRLSMNGVSRRGAFGAGSIPITVFQDFFVDIDFPVALTQNDRVTVPVALYNYIDRAQTVTVDVEAEPWFELIGPATRKIAVGALDVEGARFEIKALEPGRHTLVVRARGGRMSDAVERSVTVTPDGRPIVNTINGIVDSAAAARQQLEFTIPPDAVDGANDLFVKVYPGAFSQVVEGLENILRLPQGCFEQTSSATYPNILALAYMRATDRVRPAIELKALQYINLGYQRLLSFEVGGGGFDWFGEPPADVILTAYGLMEFCDMARVHEIDQNLIDRTRTWLLKQQEEDGTFSPSGHGVHSALARGKDEILRTTAYVAWALAESRTPREADSSRLTRGLDFIAEGATATEDPYTLALCANGLIAGNRSAEADEVLQWLHGFRQPAEGLVHWTSSAQGATFSRGAVLDIETTALAALAFLKADYEIDCAHRALAWLITRKDPRGTWHSTQATVLALRALLLGAAQTAALSAPVAISIAVNGAEPEVIDVTPETSDIVHLLDLRHRVRPGVNRVSVALDGDGRFAFQTTATHFVPWQPPTGPVGKDLSIDIAYDRTRLEADDLLIASVTVQYNRSGVAAMTIVDLGIPPGFSLVTDSLEKHRASGVIERFTATARQVIVYFRELPGGVPVVLDVAFRARYPVKVKTAPGKVYQYYEPELRDETEPVEIEVR